jgi:hypothetical protein
VVWFVVSIVILRAVYPLFRQTGMVCISNCIIPYDDSSIGGVDTWNRYYSKQQHHQFRVVLIDVYVRYPSTMVYLNVVRPIGIFHIISTLSSANAMSAPHCICTIQIIISICDWHSFIYRWTQSPGVTVGTLHVRLRAEADEQVYKINFLSFMISSICHL